MVTLAIPVVVTQVAHISMGFVDTVMVGRLGPGALAGVALGNTLFYLVTLFCMGVVMAVGPMVSHAFGAGQTDPVGRSVRQGLWLAALLSIPAFVFVWNADSILKWLGQAEESRYLATSYLRAMGWGIFPFLGFTALRSFMEAISRPRIVTIITIIGVGGNIAANYTLMFGKLGFPALGLVGTGWASAFVFWLMFLVLVAYTASKSDFEPYHIYAKLGRPDPHFFRELFRIGWPIGSSMGVEMSLFMTTVMMMGWIGTAQLAAHQVAIQCAAFTFMVPLGIGMATSVRVGQAAGARNGKGVIRAGIVGICLSISFMSLAALLFWVAPRAVISLYIDLNAPSNAEVVPIAVRLLGFAALFQIFDGIQVSTMGALRGLKDTRKPMLLAIVAYWPIGLVVSYTLAFPFGLNETGLWSGLVIALAVAASLLSIRFFRLTHPKSGQLIPSAV
jgi:MATE family, multidrug efflux pump